jgi:hypothetical protein
MPFDGGAAGDDGLGEAGLGLVGLHLVEVAFEAEGVHGVEILVHLDEAALVHEAGDALVRADGEVVAAAGADAEVLGQRVLEEALIARGALRPKAFRHVAFLLAQSSTERFLKNPMVGQSVWASCDDGPDGASPRVACRRSCRRGEKNRPAFRTVRPGQSRTRGRS